MTEPTDLKEYEVQDADGVTRTYLLNAEDAKARGAKALSVKQAPAPKNKQATPSSKG